jgi:hypothetical protein
VKSLPNTSRVRTKQFQVFYTTPRYSYIILFTSDGYLTLSWIRWIQSTSSHPVLLYLFLISFSHLRVNPSVFPTTIVYVFLIYPILATRLADLLHFTVIIIVGIVRLRTKTTEFSFFIIIIYNIQRQFNYIFNSIFSIGKRKWRKY